uniref:Uncharacterized protein n=1 Tax=Neobodo designis TaxID=312471 RepID=A0A7S1W266_NEODS|mmetsp:Transcript_49683/g.153494  ORF Transcript_49683/g.153494 Transcript_49683/m.153494 type:complete len:134 (+) Transcript_49683:26-427(+)
MSFLSKGVDKIYTAAERRVAVMEGPLALHVANHHRTGADLTHDVTREFTKNWSALWPYRRARFWREVDHFRAGGMTSIATLSMVDTIGLVRMGTRILACYMAGVMVVRGSVLPLMAPDSPLRPGLDFVNPNDL